METTIRKIGGVLLVVGILMLIGGVICTITVGTLAVPILLSSSIIVNSTGITMLRYRKR